MNPNGIYGEGRWKNLPRLLERRRSASEIWTNQVDAAANVEAEVKLDSGGRARALGCRKEEDEMKRHGGGGVKGTPSPIYKENG